LSGGIRREFDGFVDVDELRPKPMAVLPIGCNGIEARVRHGKNASFVIANLPLNSIAKVEKYFDNVIHWGPPRTADNSG
jgi:hypothetical protein